jgi:restriction system protein
VTHDTGQAVGISDAAASENNSHRRDSGPNSIESRIEAATLDLDGLLQMDWQQFEELILEAYRKRGYTATATQPSGDHGVDGFLEKNGQKIVLQCKRCRDPVGEPVLRDLLGTVTKEKADGGILVTTAVFTQGAREWARGTNLELVDRDGLIGLFSTPNQQAFPVKSVVSSQRTITPGLL